MVDEYTGMRFLNWYAKKTGMVEPTTCTRLFNQWNGKGKPVLIVRCDNAGENKDLEKECTGSNWKMVMDFEFTARDTPQQNHLAEIGIFNTSCKGRAMMSEAIIPSIYKFRCFVLATEMAGQLDWLVAVTIDGVTKTKYEHFYGRPPKFAPHLRLFGQLGVVTISNRTQHSKTNYKGIECMMTGYAVDHTEDVYRMYDPIGNNIYTTRGVK